MGPLSEWNWRVLPMSRGFLWVLQFPPTPQRCARKVNRCVYTTAICVSVGGCEWPCNERVPCPWWVHICHCCCGLDRPVFSSVGMWKCHPLLGWPLWGVIAWLDVKMLNVPDLQSLTCRMILTRMTRVIVASGLHNLTFSDSRFPTLGNMTLSGRPLPAAPTCSINMFCRESPVLWALPIFFQRLPLL